MSDTLSNFTHALIDAAKRAGADAADAIAVEGTSVSIQVLNGKLEQAERSEGTEIGLRVLIGKKQACVSASDTKPDTIKTMAERAVAMAREAPEDPFIGLADTDQLALNPEIAGLDLADPTGEPDPALLQEDAARAEAAALAVDGISQVQAASAGYSRNRLHLAASNGFSNGYARTGSGISCVAITGDGTDMERDYFGESRVYRSDLLSPEDVGQLAGTRTAEHAGARKPPTGAFPVLYDERIASSLIGHLIQAVNGSSIARGSSWARDLLNVAVLPETMTLTEDPRRARVSGSRPFDGEGLQTRARDVVKDGVLTGWTLDLATARKLGMGSTANAARGLSSPPAPSVSNLMLTQGSQTREDLIRDMGTGLLVTSLIGSSINPTTGDYSRGASGFWVENGQITYPVNECTIAGNLPDMLRTLIAANDARTHLSRVVPSLLVEGLTLAGE